MADLKITKPDPNALEATVNFLGKDGKPNGISATVFSGMSNGGTQTGSMNITYTEGPFKGVTVRLSRELDELGKPKTDALKTIVENQSGQRMDTRHVLAVRAVDHVEDHAARILRSPEYQAIISGGQGAKLAGSANDFAAEIEKKAKTGLVPPPSVVREYKQGG